MHRSAWVRLVVGGCLVLTGCAAQPPSSGSDHIEITISNDGCNPSSVQASSGEIAFVITNAGADLAEFEILRGTGVIDEVESIVPGFVVNLATVLDGGTYELVCYSLRSPRGQLAVSGGPAPSRQGSTVLAEETLARYRDEYLDYVRTEATNLVQVVEPFLSAIEAGDLEGAKAAYAASRIPWERIEPVAELFADLDVRMDAREEDFALGVDDPEFLGWHRLEKGLWADDSTDGLAPVASQLRDDVADLAGRLAVIEIDPRVMARGAGELIEEVAQSKMTGEEDRYSGTDLWSIQANVDGSRQIVEILRPSVDQLDTAYQGRVDAAFAAVDDLIATYAVGDGLALFSTIGASDLHALQAAMANLSELLSQLPGLLGLEA